MAAMPTQSSVSRKASATVSCDVGHAARSLRKLETIHGWVPLGVGRLISDQGSRSIGWDSEPRNGVKDKSGQLAFTPKRVQLLRPKGARLVS